MKSVFGKAAVLAVASTLACAAMVGCSAGNDRTPEEQVGTVGMKLRVGPGINVPSVHVVVTNTDSNTQVMERTIPAPGGGSDFNFAVSLPPGNYRVDLDAHAGAPHPVDCLGSATFTVVANQSATATISLVCDDVIQNGQQKFDVTVDSRVCPLEVDFASASPTHVRMGTEIATLSGVAHDDVGGVFSYLWTAPPNSGTFADATNPNTTFTCLAASQQVVLTLNATKPADADGLGCSDSLSVWVACVSANCPNGVIDSGETCDDGNTVDTDACPNDCNVFCGDGDIEGAEQCEDPLNTNPFCENCLIVAGCGDGIVQPPEQCDDADTNNLDECRNSCQLPRCGDGIQDMGEQCDDGNTIDTDNCRNNCTTPVAAGTCGDGIPLNKPDMSDICDPPNIPAGQCDTDCTPIESAACVGCLEAGSCQFFDCGLFTGNAPAGTFPGAGQPRANNCRALLDCMYDTNCGAGDPFIGCYCGTSGNCEGNPLGPCVNEFRGASESAIFGDIQARAGDPSFPSGLVSARIDCGKTASCAPPAICGIVP